jgi:7,8-dihydropterin-6-yl-methyl-4-(beta-D-ribofuranosyl)aminobenzene 5'-phosphate synthase
MLSRRNFGAAMASTWLLPTMALADSPPAVRDLHITVLSTMLAERGLGEWGFSALVESGGRKLLFDTGAHADLVLKNAEDLKVDLASVEELVLSHNHWDHVGGLVTLRTTLAQRNPRALQVAHVGAGIFTPRSDEGKDSNGLNKYRAAYEAAGGRFVVHDRPDALWPGVWLTGPVPRPNEERNWSGHSELLDEAGRPIGEDNLPEDCALVFDTVKGLVILTGCGHAGVVNISEYARTRVRQAPIEALVGGLHLFAASDKVIDWTVSKLKPMQVRHLLAAHCTGIEATYKLRAGLGLARGAANVAAIGSVYDLDGGVMAGKLAG